MFCHKEGVHFGPERLEKSRQSARECRARKKLRYQYLEEMISSREKAIVLLRNELDMVMFILRIICVFSTNNLLMFAVSKFRERNRRRTRSGRGHGAAAKTHESGGLFQRIQCSSARL